MISVIVPVYNSDKYLSRCLASICAQTYRDLEVIIIDDGSTDNSWAICQEWAYRDNRIRLFHQQNAGVSSARNKALSVSKGEFVMFVDSDDYMLPEMCRIMLSKMEAADADCVVCGTLENNGGKWTSEKAVDYQSLKAFKAEFAYWVTTELFSPPWNKLYRQSLIKSRFPEDVSFGEDLIFNLNYLSSCSRISVIKDALYFHEKGNEMSLVNRVYPNRLWEIEFVYGELCNFVGQPSDSIINKCLRDISVYLFAIIKNEKYSEWKNSLRDWAMKSFINNVHIFRSSVGNKQKALLCIAKLGMWRVIEALLKSNVIGEQ